MSDRGPSVRHLDAALRGASLWRAVAAEVRQWLAAQGVAPRDAVLLLPFAALLPPARRAFAEQGGWVPRVETPATLAASLAPPAPRPPQACTGDALLDRQLALQRLRRAAWAAALQQRDAAGFERLAAQLVEACLALLEAAALRPAAARAAFWALADGAIPHGGPVEAARPLALESALLREALDWARQSADGLPADTLHAHRPGAWMALRLGGADPLAEALLAGAAAAGVPALQLVADADDDAPFAAAARADGAVERWLCEDVDDEALAAATHVLRALQDGRAPVALVAVDRELTRRVAALLQRRGMALLDETGWRLDTTPAAAALVALLRAAAPHAGGDAWVAWLRWALPAAQRAALDLLEARWRGRRIPDEAAAATESLWQQALQRLQPLQGAPRPLARWFDALQRVLHDAPGLPAVLSDDAGAQVLAALRAPAADGDGLAIDIVGFARWVQQALAQAAWLPPLPEGEPEVVLTPLARAFGRPFGQVVLAGADDQRLGAALPPPGLIGDALAQQLGLPPRGHRRQRQRLALAQLLGGAPLALLRRRRDGDEARADSPDVEWALLARASAGAPEWPLRDFVPETTALPACPVAPPLPVAAGALPQRLSASQLDALRQCPYRFFARAVLRLDEADELAAATDKRDYGNWLHAVLHRFHAQRAQRGQPGDDAAALQAAADAEVAAQGLDPAGLLPFRSAFDALAPAYLRWLALREAEGWHWAEGETEQLAAPPELGGLQLFGRIDRLDRGPGGRRELLDYKTGRADELKRRVREPLEDTQLAFYAALLGPAAGGQPGGTGGFGAAYLALDEADAPVHIANPRVTEAAALLLQGLGGEWQRLRDGAALPALGQGRVCELCEARGLCRRDHWAGAGA